MPAAMDPVDATLGRLADEEHALARQPDGHGLQGHGERQLRRAARLGRYELVLGALQGSAELPELLDGLLGRIREALGADAASLLFLDESGTRLRVEACSGYADPAAALAAHMPVGEGFAGRVMESLRTQRAQTADLDSPFRALMQRERLEELAGVPMRLDGRPTGVLVLGRRDPHPFDHEDLGFLTAVGDRIALSIDRTRLLASERRLRAAAERLSRHKTDLLNMASHDLKTPLTAMRLQLHLLKAGRLGEAERHAVAVLDRNMGRLTLMLDDMLDLARLEAGTFVLHKRPTSLADLVREATEIFGPKASQAGIRLDEAIDDGVLVEADGRRLAQVVANLLSNAIRYTPKGGAIRIEASVATVAVLTVQDTGQGMTAEQLSRLFRPFSQVTGDAAEHKGTGLGLYLSHTIVAQHGGRLDLHSPGPGQGTTATVTLPRAA